MRRGLGAMWAAALLLSGCKPVGMAGEGGPSPTGVGPEPAGTNTTERMTNVNETRSGTWTPGLTDGERETLFAIAEDTLAWCVKGERKPFSFEHYQLTDLLKQKMATFVTLKLHGDLRGCIGSLAPAAPLYRSVHDNAVSAAMRDFRFSPVRPAELDKLEVHISILSLITDIASLDEFKIGEHGIIIEKGMNRAVYLPEVAGEQGWTKEETLASLSTKAGMPPDAWRAGAHFKVFSSVVLAKE